MARKPNGCKWPGCRKPKEPGKGKHYCTSHRLLCERVGHGTRNESARLKAQREHDAEAELVIEDHAHDLAVRMLIGKA